jgi:uncharacterized protein
MGFFGGGLSDGNRFVVMLVDHATQAIAAIDVLNDALDRVEPDAIERLRTLSQEASERRRVLIDELHETFVTPLDHEDIYNLAQCYEKMVVYALTTLEEMHLLQVAADEPIRRMVALAREQAQDLRLAIQQLARHPRVAGDHANRVLEKEREVERVYRAAIRDLFAHATDLPSLPGIFYRREVYRHISNMADRAVSAANVLGMVVMKIA